MRENVKPLVSDTTGLPDSLKNTAPLWEVYHAATLRISESCMRLYGDGSLYGWSDTKRVTVDGLPGRKPAPRAWRLDAKLTAESVARVRRLIVTDFSKLTGAPPVRTGQDMSMTTWQSQVDNAAHSLTLDQKRTDRVAQVLADIDRAIQAGIIPGAVPMEQ